ncbi:dynactin-associated protein [Artibeus jamaicensis]|uniref:dynactin-associated protein n=1 Tax=Artibeus jamaicensis TaxID=9417 RepID=UPI00235B1AAB|nr:dynactin-associated protein [Artibeus jamaicensis]XP_037007830.2 dynactin-associated protein [Artibeus jamaicensis]XP_037007831.2 dynactin-associated protein [Artibeus jamaicensis]XP_037007832.2 dynactin-associated protein [Artibeus jamaicensis]XP_053520264.1 dynactin-associated protein [Artibeus jamaicensis]
MDSEENTAELLPRNPYCSNEGSHCGCKLPHVTFQPQWPLQVAAKQWSLWKTFLVCLLACLIATTLVVLVLYFVHFGKPTVIIHGDGKGSHVACTSGPSPSPAPCPTPSSAPCPTPSTAPRSTPSPAPSTLPGSQSTLPSTPVTNQSSSTMVPPSAMKTTTQHEVIIEEEEGSP